MPDITPVADPDKLEVSIYIGCLGYEHRSIEALRRLDSAKASKTKLLFDYRSEFDHCYIENKREIDSSGCTVIDDLKTFLDQIRLQIAQETAPNVQLDVTSFDRRKLALILEALFENSTSIGAVILTYFPRQYVDPSGELEEVLEFGPVTPRFVGEASYERDNLSLIVGAGYEFGRVIGAIDVLEPELTYCMFPIGIDPRFERAVARNNLGFSFLDDPNLLIPYSVLNPHSTYFAIRRLIQVELNERDVLVLPLGPKIFAALSIIIALIYSPAVMVWRYSTEDLRRPNSLSDARASGDVALFAFTFSDATTTKPIVV
ncbi:hypothetical protein HFO91_09800 [Rhizobium leguminosarum]|uniref:hypothetical protein n=1 Tax=Rhizobium leguminosarum TaxID=384 RepID=UPI001C93CB3F|nr:hypothetical protein [Rhizobium leguminosarum]MBY5367400.1 hypothetical protein [Rhizobium leguminosarum]MBY5449954.1 hypothetical protein [Rhizobium leguminosarum]